MTQEEIRQYFAANVRVHVQLAGAGDGSPELAWGDTFVYVKDRAGQPRKMPFVTIVTKDYDGFDVESRLNRGGLYRLNIEVGKEKFQELFGFRVVDLPSRRESFDMSAVSDLFPHPTYGEYGWVSVVNPGNALRARVFELIDFALARALARTSS